jgi:phage shock protein C
MAASSLVRPRRGKVLAGVCAAIADRFGISRLLVRLAFVVFGLVGAGEIAYIAGWLIIPKER